MKATQYRFKTIKDDDHWECTISDNRVTGGWYPFLFGYGQTQIEAETNLLKQILP